MSKLIKLSFTCLLIIGNSLAAEYSLKEFNSWQIYLQKTDKNEKYTIQKAYFQLQKDLTSIEQLLPQKFLKEFKKVNIWISYNTQAGAAYHPSKKWLINNDRNPKMAKGIEIQNANHYIKWVKHQPMIILHELSHAYHHQILGFNHQEIKEAFENAKNQGIYESVKHVSGKKQKAYAMTNNKEYFSELTEAFFGKNDFFPFTKTELKNHDPKGYELMERIWK